MQDILFVVSLGIIGLLFLAAMALFVYGQVAGHLARRKNERTFNEALARMYQEEIAEWLRERGV